MDRALDAAGARARGSGRGVRERHVRSARDVERGGAMPGASAVLVGRSADAGRGPGGEAPRALRESSDRRERCARREAIAVPTREAGSARFGGRYVPEVLIPALDELAEAWIDAPRRPAFRAELDALLRDYVGRPTPLTFAPRLSEELGYRDLAQARGPRAHGRAQDQQHARPGAAREAPRQAADHRRDGSRAARRRDGDRLRAVRPARASCTWARRTRIDRRRTSPACGCWAPRWCR